MKKHNVGRNEAVQGIIRLRYGAQPKSPAKLLDEFNWATRGESKHQFLSKVEALLMNFIFVVPKNKMESEDKQLA